MKTMHRGRWRTTPSLFALTLALAVGSTAPALAQSATVSSDQSEAQATDSSDKSDKDTADASASASDDSLVLPTLSVSGSSYETEETDSYTSGTISVGEKDARTAREVPQSTTVLTRQYLDDRGATSLDTALRETPGVVVLDNDNGRSSLYSRGFEFDSLYFNGLPAPLSSIYGTQPDLAIVDHVEILRGPAGLFAGAGEPAGAINMKLKEPLKDFGGYVEVTGDTWGGVRGEADVSSPLTENGKLRARLVAVQDQSESWIDNNDNDTTALYGTVQGDVTDLDTVTMSYSYMTRDIAPYNGLPTYSDGTLLDVDTDTTTGADWNDFDNTVQDYIAEYEHKFADGGHAKVSARYSDRDVNFIYAYAGSAVDENGDVSNTRYLARDYDETSLALDAHISRPFVAFGQEHNILVGADYQHTKATMLQGAGLLGESNNVYHWNTHLTYPSVSYTKQTETEADKYGLYGQVRIKPIDPLTVIGGLRGTWYSADTDNLLTGTTSSSDDINGKLTPYGGVTLDLNDDLTAYASYTQIFQPQTDVDVNGETIDPRTGSQYEVGMKGSFPNGINASAALFQLTDKNRAMEDEDGNTVASEEVRARGFEVEASGTVAPGWDVMAGYTYTTSKYVNGDSEGETYATTTPKHMVQVWAKHKMEILPKLTLGAGVKMFSDTTAISAGQTIKADGYAVVDTMASYQLTDDLQATLTVNNLFNKKYYSRVGGTTVFNFYGEPLSAALRLKATF